MKLRAIALSPLQCRLRPAWLLTACLCTLMLQSAPAQLTRGYLSGTVQDVSGGVIPLARVSAVNLTTQIKRATFSNPAGVYRFVAIEPGAYRIEFFRDGFQTSVLERIEVGANQEVVINQTLGIAKAATAIDVSDVEGTTLSKA